MPNMGIILKFERYKGDEGASEAIIKLDGNPIRMKVSKAGGLTIYINVACEIFMRVLWWEMERSKQKGRPLAGLMCRYVFFFN